MQVIQPTLFQVSRTPCASCSPRARQSGATMIEILVSVLILSFGVLGMSALQMRALQSNQSSVQRSQALMLAQYMMDTMRVDRVTAGAGGYNIGSASNYICSAASLPSSVRSTLARANLTNWLNALDTTMGSQVGDSCATVACTANFQCNVNIRWDDSKAGGTGTQTFTISSVL